MSDNSNNTNRDPVAEFLARGGKIQTIEEGVRSLSEREIHTRANGPDKKSYTERRMRSAENQEGLEEHHPYYRQ